MPDKYDVDNEAVYEDSHGSLWCNKCDIELEWDTPANCSCKVASDTSLPCDACMGEPYRCRRCKLKYYEP